MHQERPQTIGWGRPNLVCNAKKKMLEAILKNGWVESQTLELRPMQDLS